MLKDGLALHGKYTLTFRDVSGNVTRKYEFKNLVVDAGLAIFASALSLDYIAVGDDDTAVSAADTSLGNETDRQQVQSSQSVGNKKYVSTYFGLTEAVGTINEVGCFSGGSATANSGTLFSRISTESAELPVEKLNTESLTIDYEVEVVNA